MVPDLVATEIEPAVVLPLETSYGFISIAICSTKSILIGFLIVPNPLSFNPNGSLKLIPSIVKSLNLGLAPIILIWASLPTPPLTVTLGSILAKSATDRLIVGTLSISVLVNSVPVPILKAEGALPVTSTISTVALVKVTFTLSGSPKFKYNPSMDSDLYPVAETSKV